MLEYLIGYSLVCLCFYGNGMVNAKISCLGEDGKPVDMYVLYKLPKLYWVDDAPDYVRDGAGYAYLDNTKMEFSLSPLLINASESAAGRTLSQVYKAFEGRSKPTDQTHLFYDDANPEGDEFFDNGHTKGAVAFDGETGFWLVHSVPRYPPTVADGYGYPSSGHRYGQMYLCITLNTSTVDDIGLQLRYNNPHIHDYYMPEQMKDAFVNIHELTQGKIIQKPTNNTLQFKSLDGTKFTSFAKTNTFGEDLYAKFVAPELQVDLLTETWQNGRGDLGPFCEGKYTVEDVSNINIKFTGGTEYSFHNSNDHSKFAISKTADRPFVCIGDINRQEGQFKRGGGTVCTLNKTLWNQFHKLVGSVHTCQQKFAEVEI